MSANAKTDITSTDLQRNWGAVIAEIHAGEVVTVTNHGRPELVVVPPRVYEDLLKARRDLLEMRLKEIGTRHASG